MATSGGKQTQSDECFDVKCTICTRNNRIKQAQQYCTGCKKNLCYDCVEIHNDYHEGHTVVDGHGDDEEVNLLTEKCGKHKNEVIKLFCVDHDTLVCCACVPEHRKCEELKHITNSIEDLNKDQKVHEVPDQLKTTLQNIGQVLTSLEQYIQELSQREHKLLEELEEYTKMLLFKIEGLQRSARKEINIKHAKFASEAREKRDACVTAKTGIIKCMDNKTSTGNRKAHLFILKKKGQSMTKNVETLCSESENMVKRLKFQFKPDMRIQDTLNEFISLVSSKVNIDASVKDDATLCGIEVCCILPDGTVILTDDMNKRVKHVKTSNFTIKEHCVLTPGLWGITCIGPHEVAVGTLTTSVAVVSLGNKMTRTSTIQLNHDCSRIEHSNGELFTTYSSHVYDLTGTLLRTICKNRSGENMFSNIMDIVVNQTGDRVYVADYYKGLICTDRVGQEVFKLSDKELGLSRAYGLCTYPQWIVI